MTTKRRTRPPTLAARRLGMLLREMRDAAGLSTTEVAEHLDMSQPTVSRIENARTPITKGTLLLMLKLYGVVDEDEQAAYWQMARAGRERGWWEAYRDVLGAPLETYVALEAEATTVRSWSLGTIPGLLQTEDYARATFRGNVAPTPPHEIDRLVAARMARQQRLGAGLNLWAVLDESLLSRPVGGIEVLKAQLNHLLAQPPGVTLQVVPIGEAWHAGLSCSFSLLMFSDHPAVALVEAVNDDLHLDEAEQVNRYNTAHDYLRAAAASPVDSLGIIRAARDRLT